MMIHYGIFNPIGTVWVAVLVAVVVWGVSLWLLQQVWSHLTGEHCIQLNTALLYSWGALLEVPPPDPSVSTSGQVNAHAFFSVI